MRPAGKIFLASYCIRSVVAVVCGSYLLWDSTMVSVGRSVRSSICADLLSTDEGTLIPLIPPLGIGQVHQV